MYTDHNEASEDDIEDKSWSRQNTSFGSSHHQKMPSMPASLAMPRKPVLTGFQTGSTGNVDAAWRLNSSFGNVAGSSSVSSFSPRSNSSTSSRNGGGGGSTVSSNGSHRLEARKTKTKTSSDVINSLSLEPKDDESLEAESNPIIS